MYKYLIQYHWLMPGLRLSTKFCNDDDDERYLMKGLTGGSGTDDDTTQDAGWDDSRIPVLHRSQLSGECGLKTIVGGAVVAKSSGLLNSASPRMEDPLGCLGKGGGRDAGYPSLHVDPIAGWI